MREEKPVERRRVIVTGASGFLGRRRFGRPWMASYLDRQLRVDASLTRGRLGWAPNPRLLISRRKTSNGW